MDKAIHRTESDYIVLDFDWGTLTWHACRELGNSEEQTLGRCVIKVGAENPRHFHPNCEEILHVLHGDILHSIGDETSVAMAPGDTISIPANVLHNARNVGDDDAVLLISFSSAARETVGE